MNQKQIGAYVAKATKKTCTGHTHIICLCTACEARRALERRNASFQLMKAHHEAHMKRRGYAVSVLTSCTA